MSRRPSTTVTVIQVTPLKGCVTHVTLRRVTVTGSGGAMLAGMRIMVLLLAVLSLVGLAALGFVFYELFQPA